MSPRESYKDPVDSSTDNRVVQDDRPLRVLVQTKTQLVPGDKSTEFRQRFEAMRRMICHHVWGRDFDQFRERFWSKGEFDLNDRDCWFLVDHCDPSSELDPNLPLLRYRWTGTELSVVSVVRESIKSKTMDRIANSPNLSASLSSLRFPAKCAASFSATRSGGQNCATRNTFQAQGRPATTDRMLRKCASSGRCCGPHSFPASVLPTSSLGLWRTIRRRPRGSRPASRLRLGRGSMILPSILEKSWATTSGWKILPKGTMQCLAMELNV